MGVFDEVFGPKRTRFDDWREQQDYLKYNKSAEEVAIERERARLEADRMKPAPNWAARLAEDMLLKNTGRSEAIRTKGQVADVLEMFKPKTKEPYTLSKDETRKNIYDETVATGIRTPLKKSTLQEKLEEARRLNYSDEQIEKILDADIPPPTLYPTTKGYQPPDVAIGVGKAFPPKGSPKAPTSMQIDKHLGSLIKDKTRLEQTKGFSFLETMGLKDDPAFASMMQKGDVDGAVEWFKAEIEKYKKLQQGLDMTSPISPPKQKPLKLKLKSAEEVRRHYKQGKITRSKALEALKGF